MFEVHKVKDTGGGIGRVHGRGARALSVQGLRKALWGWGYVQGLSWSGAGEALRGLGEEGCRKKGHEVEGY